MATTLDGDSESNRLITWPPVTNKKTEIEGYFFKNFKMGDFNPWRTLLEPHFIIPESLVASCSVVSARIAEGMLHFPNNDRYTVDRLIDRYFDRKAHQPDISWSAWGSCKHTYNRQKRWMHRMS